MYGFGSGSPDQNSRSTYFIYGSLICISVMYICRVQDLDMLCANLRCYTAWDKRECLTVWSMLHSLEI